jgi:predicted nucleotidyltransferase component of viral defense system
MNMTTLDFLVQRAASRMQEPALKNVIEKEIIHHDILRILSEGGFLNRLTFVGGTCLRLVYGSSRYSEDLDFTVGPQSLKDSDLLPLSEALSAGLSSKYGVAVSVIDPRRGKVGNVDTWTVKIVTAPGEKGMPEQKINIDVALTSSQTRLAHPLMNHYSIDLGTDGVIINCQSEEEILADKLVAFVGRDKIKPRDLWDTGMLKQRCDLTKAWSHVGVKLEERGISQDTYFREYENRLRNMETEAGQKEGFEREMTRFLPLKVYQRTVLQNEFWQSIVNTQAMLLVKGKHLVLKTGRDDGWEF